MGVITVGPPSYTWVTCRHAAHRTCKRLLPAREDDGPHGCVLLEGLQRLVELLDQAVAERIECFGAVQSDQPHALVLPLLFCDDVLKVSPWDKEQKGDFYSYSVGSGSRVKPRTDM